MKMPQNSWNLLQRFVERRVELIKKKKNLPKKSNFTFSQCFVNLPQPKFYRKNSKNKSRLKVHTNILQHKNFIPLIFNKTLFSSFFPILLESLFKKQVV